MWLVEDRRAFLTSSAVLPFAHYATFYLTSPLRFPSSCLRSQDNIDILYYGPLYLPLRCGVINFLSPHDVLKHHITSLKTHPIFQQLRNYRRKTVLPINIHFLYFFTHFKSFSSTTSRELRQQFAACRG